MKRLPFVVLQINSLKISDFTNLVFSYIYSIKLIHIFLLEKRSMHIIKFFKPIGTFIYKNSFMKSYLYLEQKFVNISSSKNIHSSVIIMFLL